MAIKASRDFRAQVQGRRQRHMSSLHGKGNRIRCSLTERKVF